MQTFFVVEVKVQRCSLGRIYLIIVSSFLSQILRSFFKQLPIFLCRSSSKNKILIYLIYAVAAWEDQYTILLLYVEKSFCINVTFYIL